MARRTADFARHPPLRGPVRPPASGDCLKALRAKPAIPGLTDAIVGLSDDQWRRAVARLREVRLLGRPTPPLPKRSTPIRWCASGSATGCDRPTKRPGKPPTAASMSTCATRPRRAKRRRSELAPLYQAIAHGCRAGRYKRRSRKSIRIASAAGGRRRTRILFVQKTGRFGSDLAAISWFFDQPYETPVAALTPPDAPGSSATPASGCARTGVSGGAARDACGSAQDGRSAGLENAAIAASNLSQTELLLGDVAAAAATAETQSCLRIERQCILNDRSPRDLGRRAPRRRRMEKAAGLFADAERRQQELQPENPLLYSLQGYRYCDLLLSGASAEARDRATRL